LSSAVAGAKPPNSKRPKTRSKNKSATRLSALLGVGLRPGSIVASAPILSTRAGLPVYIPHLPVRPRLIERLNERLRVSAGGTPGVTLVSAPAGFGKTTLVSE